MLIKLMLSLTLWTTIQNAPAQPVQKTPEVAATAVDPEIATQFLQVRRICVESFGDDPASRELQAMVINALNESKKFTLTEKCDKADATLKGISTEQVHQEARSSSEGTSIRHADISESSHATETINEVRVAVRLVAKESGDVIWSTTQESKGAKYKGASADAAEKIVKQLLRDLEKIQKAQSRDSSQAPKHPN